jgi:hypothetical protein
MIIKGKSRSGPRALAAHLSNVETNERITVLEIRGTVAQDLKGALVEMDAYGLGTRCEKPLYHAAISPEPPHRLTDRQRAIAVNTLEVDLGLEGHARVVVLHEKLGREHIHIVWSRIDLDKMRSVSDSHNYRKHEQAARSLERQFDHERVQGAHAERDGAERPNRTPSRAELRQEERTGIRGKDVRLDVTEAFRASDNAAAFQAAVEEKGYILAKGDRRDFVIVDHAGGIHSLARRIEGGKAADLREFMSPLNRDLLPTAEQARSAQIERASIKEEREAWNWYYGDGKNPYRWQKANDKNEQGDIAKKYAKGDDYVSQTRAALDEHQKRQEKQNDKFSKGEISDAKSDRIRRLLNEENWEERSHDDDQEPDRQRPAPGGGRTRSR